jgi:hypothetical protein
MSGTKVWSWLTPLLVLAAMILGFSILWHFAGEQNEDVMTNGIETTATVYDEGKRMIKVKYHVNGELRTNFTGKGFSNIEDGEQFLMNYLSTDPDKIVVFFDKPVLSDEHEYKSTTCTSMSKTLSIIDFYYNLNGATYRRKTLFRGHTLNPSHYEVWYRTANPKISYLVKKEN